LSIAPEVNGGAASGTEVLSVCGLSEIGFTFFLEILREV
jgi:hypothetical protein